MYIEQFKLYSRSITNPNIRIDSLQIESVKVEMHIMSMEYNLDTKNLENHEQKLKSIKKFSDWLNQEIKFVKKEFEIDIENARKKAWDGWEWTPFPIVWDRFTYNLFEPEIRKADKKIQWINWLLSHISEAENDFWRLSDELSNSAACHFVDISIKTGFHFNTELDVLKHCLNIKIEFVRFLLTVADVCQYKTNKKNNHQTKPSFDYNKLDQLSEIILNTLKARRHLGESENWNEVKRDLRNYVNMPDLEIVLSEIEVNDRYVPGIILKKKNSPYIYKQIADSTFQKNLSILKKLLLLK